MQEELSTLTIPAAILASLDGKKFVLVGFPRDEAHLLASALQETRSLSYSGDPRELPPSSDEVEASDTIILNLTDALQETKWMIRTEIVRSGKPLLLIGTQSDIYSRSALEEAADDVLVRPCNPAEILLRCHRLLSRTTEPRIHRAKNWAAKLLLVDDDKSILDLLSSVLISHNIDCQSAEDGASALRLARRMMPDLVILDLTLPLMNGFEVLEALRKDPGTHAVKVILLTGNQDVAAVVKGRELGADDYITKPFNHLELLARVRKLLPPVNLSRPLKTRKVFTR